MTRNRRDNDPERTNEPAGTADNTSGSTRRDFLKMAGLAAAGSLLAATSEAVPSATMGTIKGKAVPAQLKPAPIKPVVPRATGRVLGANDRINIAHIGTGGQGGSHIYLLGERFKENNTRSIAVCDVWEKRLEGAKNGVMRFDSEAKVQMDEDYRKILENKDVDAVVIGTPEHMVLHQQNWLAAIRGTAKLACPIDLALPVQTIVSLAEMSEVQGKTMHFDPVNRKIVS